MGKVGWWCGVHAAGTKPRAKAGWPGSRQLNAACACPPRSHCPLQGEAIATTQNFVKDTAAPKGERRWRGDAFRPPGRGLAAAPCCTGAVGQQRTLPLAAHCSRVHGDLAGSHHHGRRCGACLQRRRRHGRELHLHPGGQVGRVRLLCQAMLFSWGGAAAACPASCHLGSAAYPHPRLPRCLQRHRGAAAPGAGRRRQERDAGGGAGPALRLHLAAAPALAAAGRVGAERGGARPRRQRGGAAAVRLARGLRPGLALHPLPQVRDAEQLRRG